jgi:hypothetical protein
VESARKVAGRKCSIDSRDRRLGVPPQRQASAMQAQVSCGTAPLLWQACHGTIVATAAAARPPRSAPRPPLHVDRWLVPKFQWRPPNNSKHRPKV